MAMFPCITGIPTKLNSDMQSVLNKKMGTSGQTYPSQTWADEVNLLGKLPEKTASGAIANFADGADDVPVKEAKFYFLPKQASGTPTPSSPLAIDGWTGLTCYKQKKNLLDDTKKVAINNNIWIGSDTPYTLNDYVSVTLNAGTYTFSVTTKDETTTNLYVALKGDSTYIARATNNTKVSFTLTERSAIRVWCYKSGYATDVTNIATAQIEVGSSASTYEAYATPTTYPVSWSEHGTIYGGYVDATRGKVVKTHGSVDLGTLDWTITQTLQEERAFYTDDLSSVIDPPFSNNIAIDGYCENLPVNSQNNVMNASASGICSNTSGRVYIFNYSYNSMTKEQFTSAVNGKLFVYPLATPVEYDITAFTPNSLYGTNNFFSDANGDTEVTYREDIDLVLSSLQGNRGLMVSSMRTNIEESEEMSDNSDNTEEQEEER